MAQSSSGEANNSGIEQTNVVKSSTVRKGKCASKLNPLEGNSILHEVSETPPLEQWSGLGK